MRDTHCVSNGDTIMTKDAGFRIRLDAGLRRNFVDACKQQDRSAAQVIRDFMRRYVDRHADDAQGELFSGVQAKSRSMPRR